MDNSLSLKQTKIFLTLSITSLIVLHCIAMLLRLYYPLESLFPLLDRFNLDQEQSIPTWYSQTLLFIAAMLLLVIGWTKRRSTAPFAMRWLVLSGIFVYLSLDEGATLHEMVGEYIKGALPNLTGALYYAWVLPFGLAVIAFTAAYLQFLKHLSSKERYWLVTAGIIYVSGALGMEMIGGIVLSSSTEPLYYALCVTLEEALELTGCALLITMLLTYIKSHDITHAIRVTT